MNEETQQLTKPKYDEQRSSHVGGISLRGWLALIITVTVCFMALMVIPVNEPLYTLAIMVLSFYFGKEQGKKENPK